MAVCRERLTMANQPTSAESSTAEQLPSTIRLRDGAKALITGSEGVLLIKERHADGTPFWTLPGGGVHAHETLAEGLRREMAEELHCTCRVADRVTEFWYAHDSLDGVISRYAVFDCSLLSTITPDDDEGICELRWAPPTDPPAGTLPQVRQVCRRACDEQ
jgi:8-oxo-dGTP diphosphatase